MARGIWVSPDEFVAFSEPQKSLTAQIASRSRAIDFYGLGMYLPNPDPILKAQGRDIRIYRELRTDPLVGGCIRRRKAALKSLERGLERGHASARVFRFIRDMLDDLDLSRIIGEMSDAVLYGYQPCEIMWGRSVRAWAVTDIVGKPPEWFQFDTDNCLRFRARDAGVEGELLSPSKFVVPAQDASYDNPYGFPDLSMCFWPVAFKKGGMKFWLRFAEKFGSPWVIGKHPRGANDAEIEKLLDSMEQMVEDAVAAIPDDSSIELKAADGKADSSEVFRELITLSRSEISIALLGQNQTTEANSNKASAQAGLEVTADIRDADADIIQAAVNQVIRTVVTLNFGDVPCPVWAMWEQETIDDTRATRDEKLTRAGLRLTPQYFKREYQLQDGIAYDVVFTNAGTGVLLSGMVRAHATGECDRCLELASFDIAGEIEEFYLFEEPEDPEAYEDGYELLGEDRIVDLGEPINDAVVMDTPFVVLCKPDCRGLCPTCGINLNVEQCDCAAQAEAEWAAATENPFAALKNLNLDE